MKRRRKINRWGKTFGTRKRDSFMIKRFAKTSLKKGSFFSGPVPRQESSSLKIRDLGQPGGPRQSESGNPLLDVREKDRTGSKFPLPMAAAGVTTPRELRSLVNLPRKWVENTSGKKALARKRGGLVLSAGGPRTPESPLLSLPSQSGRQNPCKRSGRR